MNKLYILGALALANVEAATAHFRVQKTLATLPVGSFTYTVSATDCYTAATATTLGMNNIYYQYYSFTVAAGSVALATPAPADTTSLAHNYTFNACKHTHLYNWMAQPVIGTSSLTAGLATQLVAYGYQLTGTAVTSCVNTIATGATTSLQTGTAFTGAAWQSFATYLTADASDSASNTAIAQNIRLSVKTTGLENLIAKKAITLLAFIDNTADGIITGNADSNLYWDFMQTHVIQGQTQFGRGGGASTSPCGWFVIYAYEAPGPEVLTSGASIGSSLAESASTADAQTAFSSITVHMWTDNSMVVAASSVVLSAFGALLF